MFTYIENLKKEYEETNDKIEKYEIINKLNQEKISSMRIIDEYLSREDRTWEKCKKVCKHEKEIIKRINKILDWINNN